MKKIYGLNYIRGICAMLVVLYHYTTRYLDVVLEMGAEQNHIGLWWGCWAVSAFFILSGFLTVANVDETLTPAKFAFKRISRLYPAYWIAIIITTLVTYCVNSDLKVGLIPTFINFTMLQDFLGVESVDGAYWTLRVELWFYIIVALTLFLRKRNYNVLSTLWLAAVLIVRLLSKDILAGTILLKIVRAVFMVDWAHVFIMGISLNQILKNKKAVLPYINLAVCMVIEYNMQSIGRFLFVTAILLLCFLFAETKLRFKYDKPLNFLAEISFPLYLVHQKVGYIIIQAFESRWFGTITATVVSIIVAYLIHRYIEKPTGILMKKKFKKFT